MKLKGSCHCGKVKFSVQSQTFYPYQECFCSICRKTQGGGGFAINIGADAKTLKIIGQGKRYISVYRAKVTNPHKKAYKSSSERNFCKVCSSGLWLFDPEWPDLIHPFASAIDTPLPVPPDKTQIMLDFKASWIELKKLKRDKHFKRYPKESLAHWHERVIGID